MKKIITILVLMFTLLNVNAQRQISGNVKFLSYPNTRTTGIVPLNFLITDGVGNMYSKEVSYLYNTTNANRGDVNWRSLISYTKVVENSVPNTPLEIKSNGLGELRFNQLNSCTGSLIYYGGTGQFKFKVDNSGNGHFSSNLIIEEDLILKSPNGSSFNLSVDDSGVLTVTAL